MRSSDRKPGKAHTSEAVADDQEERRKLDRLNELADIQAVLALPAGRRMLWRLFEAARIFNTTFTGNSTGMFLEGQRNLGLIFFADMMEVSPERLAQMWEESRRTEDERELADSRRGPE